MALVRDSSGRLVADELWNWLRRKSRVGDGGTLPVKCLFTGITGGDSRTGDCTDDADTKVSSEDTVSADVGRASVGVGGVVLGRDSRGSSGGAARFCVIVGDFSCETLLDTTFGLLVPLGCGGVGGRCFGCSLGLGVRF